MPGSDSWLVVEPPSSGGVAMSLFSTPRWGAVRERDVVCF